MSRQQPKIFISYSHDSEVHKQLVLQLASRLRTDGVHCMMDRYIVFPAEGWNLWMEKQIEIADFTLLMCTEVYLRRFRKEEIPGKGKGVAWEGAIITQTFYENCSQNTQFISLLPDAGYEGHIPLVLKAYPFFRIFSQYNELYRLLTHQPEVVMPEVGPLKNMPPLELKSSSQFVETNMVSANVDTKILRTLYNYFQQHPGVPQVSFQELIKLTDVKEEKLIQYLYTLQEKKWLAYELTEKAEGGLVWLTQLGIRVAKDML